jgi:hypothetical protein
MADEADHAHELEQLALSEALARRKPDSRLTPRGSCHNCGEKLAPRKGPKGLEHVQIFCDKDCADDWETMQNARRNR